MIDPPDGAGLLDVARRILLDELLPLLPSDKTYDARMIARAMAIAERELRQGDAAAKDATGLIAAFLRQAGIQAEPTEEALAELIRQETIPPRDSHALRQLLAALTRAKLALSNPGYLPPHTG